jgi:hypothetical protein
VDQFSGAGQAPGFIFEDLKALGFLGAQHLVLGPPAVQLGFVDALLPGHTSNAHPGQLRLGNDPDDLFHREPKLPHEVSPIGGPIFIAVYFLGSCSLDLLDDFVLDLHL